MSRMLSLLGLFGTALLLLAAVLSTSAGGDKASASRLGEVSAQTPIQRAGKARIKLSLNAYSFNKLLNDSVKGRGQGVTLFDLLDFCAENDLDAIDATGYYFPGYPKVPDAKFVNDFKRRAFVLGIAISGTGVRNNFTTPNKEARARDVELVKNWVEVAAHLGAPVLRVFAGPPPAAGHTWDETAGWLVEDLKKCVEHGQKHGVVIGIQNHDDFLKTAEQTLKIVKMVDSEWFGVVVDTGSFRSDDPYKDIAAVAPYAVNWQIKEGLVVGGKGAKMDYKKLARIARDSGYRGYMPMETQSADPRASVRQVVKEMRAALKEE